MASLRLSDLLRGPSTATYPTTRESYGYTPTLMISITLSAELKFQCNMSLIVKTETAVRCQGRCCDKRKQIGYVESTFTQTVKRLQGWYLVVMKIVCQ